MQDNKQPTGQSVPPSSLVPDIVKDIPVAAPDVKTGPLNDDDELDKIMRDVGKDLRQVSQKRPDHHWFSRQKKPKAEAKFSARPVEPAKPSPAAPLKSATPAPAKPIPASAPAIVNLAAPAKTKPPKTSRAPVGTVVLAMIVTCGLIAAAYYAYK